MILASLLLSIGGFAVLAGAMRRHAKQIGLPPLPPTRLRLVGCVLQAASFALLLERMGWRMATIAWIGQAVLAAAICVVTLSVRVHSTASSINRARQGDRRGGKTQPGQIDGSTSSVNIIEI